MSALFLLNLLEMMANQKGFAVVEFVEEGSVEVPSKWIDRAKQMCTFPTGPTGNSLRKKVDSVPVSSWPTYKIKIRGFSSKIQVVLILVNCSRKLIN